MKVGFVGLLGLLFLGLKLGHVIDWSWWWVLAPFWLGPAIVIGCALLVGLVHLFEDEHTRNLRKLSDSLGSMERALRKRRN